MKMENNMITTKQITMTTDQWSKVERIIYGMVDNGDVGEIIKWTDILVAMDLWTYQDRKNFFMENGLKIVYQENYNPQINGDY